MKLVGNWLVENVISINKLLTSNSTFSTVYNLLEIYNMVQK